MTDQTPTKTFSRYYKLSVHRSGKYLYASTQPTTIDEKTGKKECRHIHWGTLDDELRFYPNQRYLLASEEERRHLIFPDNWDLSLLENMYVTEYFERRLKYEKKSYALTGAYPAVQTKSVEAEQIYRLIHSLQKSELAPSAILDAVLAMEGTS